MRDRPDLYVILGVEPSASLEQIQAAYRQRVRVIHPDRFDRARTPEAWAHANRMLQELNEAYRILSDASLRREYDLQFCSRNSTPTPAFAGYGSPSASASPAAQRLRTPHLPRLAIIAGIAGLTLWGIFADWKEQRTTDAFFLSPSSPASPSDTNAIVDYTELARSLGGKPVDDPGAVTTGRFSPEDIDPPALFGCEPEVSPSSLPANGAIWRYDDSVPVAPLEIRVQGADQYLVKLERDGELAAAMLIRPSSTTNMLMPLGNYTLKYAVGSGEYWCGEMARFPFGRQTTFHKADEVFSFRRESVGYTGYTIELFLQPNGNLGTSRLSPRVW